MIHQELYTLAEASTFIGLPEHATIDLIRTEELPVCFVFDGPISGADIKHADGQVENAGLTTTEFKGVLKSLAPPQSDSILTACLVEVVREDGGRRVNRPNGLLMPTEHSYGGRIKAGERVTGFVDYFEISSENWLFHIDDLRALMDEEVGAGVTATGQAAMTAPPKGSAMTAKEIKSAFPDYDFGEALKKCTSGNYQWLDGTWIRKGTKMPGDATTFNPVKVAIALVSAKKMTLNSCDVIFRSVLAGWSSEWEKASELLR